MITAKSKKESGAIRFCSTRHIFEFYRILCTIMTVIDICAGCFSNTAGISGWVPTRNTHIYEDLEEYKTVFFKA